MNDERQPENRRPWYEAYAERTWLAILAGILVSVALLFVGVALGGGGRDHIVPVGALVAATIGGGIALGQLQVARKRHEEQTKADLRRHDAQTKADFQRRVTESFTKAVEQLGSEHLPVRVGGIFALERISQESDEDYWTVMETLTAFVRERARWKEPSLASAESTKDKNRIPTDVAAVIAVIKRRKQKNREQETREGWYLDLEATNLRGAALDSAYLEGANLTDAHLEGANLMKANLKKAYLWEARLEGALLHGAHLEGTILRKAHLERAILKLAHLEGASLSEAHFEGADLSHCRGLVPGQLDNAFGNAETRLPYGLEPPKHWM